MKLIVKITIYAFLLQAWILRKVNHYKIERSWYDLRKDIITYDQRKEIVERRLLIIDDLIKISDSLHCELDKL